MIKEKEKVNQQEKIPKKPCPAYLQENYPYRATGESITDIDSIKGIGVLYELKCMTPDCNLSVRTQGVNLQSLYNKMSLEGCPVCKGKEFEIRKIKTDFKA